LINENFVLNLGFEKGYNRRMEVCMKSGYGLIGVLFALLIIALLFSNYFPTGGSRETTAQGPVAAIDKAWDATCKANRVAIQNALQMYKMNHELPKNLDFKSLSSLINLPAMPSNCPCKYSLDQNGEVVCETHGK